MKILRTALLFEGNNFVGREYFNALDAAGRRPGLLIEIGEMSEASIEREIERTGGLWNPATMPREVEIDRFASLDDPDLRDLLDSSNIDVAIQGGVGILKAPLLETASIGFLNVHPGRLPQYRGNSCPEWALYNGEEVVATAHLVDEGIDTGPVVCSQPYRAPSGEGYNAFRAKLYAHCASVLLDALDVLECSGQAAAEHQDESDACYWPPIPEDKLAEVKRVMGL